MLENSFKLFILKDESTTYKTYTYVIVEPNSLETIIIDPACEREKIEQLIASYGLKMKYILLTHTHSDHTAQVEWLYQKYQIQVCLSTDEAHFYDYYIPNMKLLNDGDILHMGAINVKCLLTPGHSKGSMCYWIGEKLFTGDTLFIEGCGMCSAAGASVDEMYQSIQHIKAIIPKNTEIYPGHQYDSPPGQKFVFLFEKNIYLLIDNKEDFVQFRMRKNQNNLLNFQ